MMKMYGGGMDMSMFGAEGETLVLNANHPLVTYITEHEDDANTKLLTESYCSHIPGTQIIDGGVLYMVFELK